MRQENVMHLSLDEIIVPDSRRDVDPEIVKHLAASIKEIGLQHPITVQANKGQFTLVAGRHRLEAVRSIGEDRIAATVVKFNSIEAELWEISENLHRADLSQIERDVQVARWAELRKQKRELERARDGKDVSRQADAKPMGGRPEGGIREAARELGMSEVDVRRAIKVASLSDEAKSIARDTGLDDNRSALLEASREPTERQAEKLAEIAAEKTQPHSAESLENRQYRTLVQAWNAASDRVRDRFAAEIAASEYAA